MTAPARIAAHKTLRLVGRRRADLADAIARSREPLDDDRDRALAAEIATGTLRWQARLDWIIDRRLDRSPDDLDAEVRDVLRAAVYQLRHLERVPAHAVVSDAVSLARDVGLGRAAGFVNALLRRIAREDDALPPHPGAPPSVADGPYLDAWRNRALDYLSVTWSHPRWLVGRWLDRMGLEATEAWVRFNNSPAPVTLRAHVARIGRDELRRRLADVGVAVEPARYSPDALVVTGGNPLRTALAREGLFWVQDEASQLVPLALAPGQYRRVLDACAAPGGKTTQLAILAPRPLVVAADLRHRRLALLRGTVEASGVRNVRLVAADLARALPFGPCFDAVLIDAPCSGLGTIRRDPEIRWRRTAADVARLADVQFIMLRHAAAAVRPGGRLLYATCSSEPEENRLVVERFLADHPAFAAVRLPLQGSPLPSGVVAADGTLDTCPDRHGLEVFFAALMTRQR